MGARTSISNLNLIIEYNPNAFAGFITLFTYTTVQGYSLIRGRKELIVSKYNEKQNFKKLKRVLDLNSDAIVILNDKKITYSNSAFESMLEKYNIDKEDISKGVFLT